MKKFEREIKIYRTIDKVIDFAILKIVNPTALLHFDERRRSFIY